MSEQLIPLTSIRPSPLNARKSFELKDTLELASSILAAGQLHQAIKVRPTASGKFEIVMGERRFRAHEWLANQGHHQFTSIRATVEDMTDDQAHVAMLVENLQRKNVCPVEEANSFHSLMQRDGFDECKIAKLVGIEPHRVRERLALVNLEPQVQHLVKTGHIAMTCGVEIARLPRHQQIEMVKRVGSGKLSGIAEIRAAVNALVERDAQQEMMPMPKADPHEVAVVNRMEKKVEQIKVMVASGWKDGECVIAKKVGPDRARKMAEELDTIRLHLSRMARDLREAAAQAEIAGQ